MNFFKRIIIILTLIIFFMLILPLVAVNTIKTESGMLFSLFSFFVINPVISVFVGVLSAKNVRVLWFTPILVACLFWLFSSVTYVTAFPIVYSLIYFVLCSLSMIITKIVTKHR